MNLATAATYFAETAVSGWNGTTWVENAGLVTLLAYDRVIHEAEFDSKRRTILVSHEDTVTTAYSVIKFPESGDVYLVGAENSDILGDRYSRSVIIHRANAFCTLYDFTKVTKASGMPGTATRHALGNYWGDIGRTGAANSREFDGVAFSQTQITLPRDCPVDTDHEVSANGKYYDIKEAYVFNGFRQCHALAKRSA